MKPTRAAQRLTLAVFYVLLVGCYPGPGRLSEAGERLRPCPRTPNCVSTEAEDQRHSISPVPFSGTAETAQAHARAALLQEPRVTIVAERPGYLRAEARSEVIRFIDDVEVVVDDEAKLIRFRSASRVGRSDLGVNRERMERFSRRFRALDAQP